MERPHRLTKTAGVAAMVAWVTLLAGPMPAANDAAVDLAPGPDLTVIGLTAEQEAIIDWAIARFDEAGLELPPIDVVGYEDDAPCRGRLGAARWSDGRSQIILCTTGAGEEQEMLIVHELAHAWDRHDLDDDRRHAFLAIRGLEQWRGDAGWHDRGAEHAADIIVWGLLDRRVRSGHILDGCTELRQGYEVLTQRPPPQVIRIRCNR